MQSFNISVAAALALQEVTKRARATAGDRYYLTNEEKRELLMEWILQTLQPRIRERVLKRLESSRETRGDRAGRIGNKGS